MPQTRNPDKIRNILFIEDDSRFYIQLRYALESERSKCVTHTSSKVNLIQRGVFGFDQYDLVVFDYVDKNADLELLYYLQSASAVVPFPLIIICSTLDKVMLLQAFGEGTRGCLYKKNVVEDLKDYLLSSFYSTHIAICPAVFEYMLNVSPPEYFIKKFAYRLTERESSIVVLLQSGLSQKDIGAKLSIATGTVNQYLNAIYNKLNVNSKGELMYKLFQ